jgi:hypothetical protein
VRGRRNWEEPQIVPQQVPSLVTVSPVGGFGYWALTTWQVQTKLNLSSIAQFSSQEGLANEISDRGKWTLKTFRPVSTRPRCGADAENIQKGGMNRSAHAPRDDVSMAIQIFLS